MNTLNFSIKINASKEKVWNALWNETNYNEWTKAFIEGSHAVSDWNEGSHIRFLGPNNNGMFAVIDKKIPNQQMTFKHLGEIKNGIEEPKDWAGALESYFLSESNGVTDLKVEADASKEMEQMFQDMFPKALEIVKQIAEK
jgi:hypothetical protein